MNVLGDALGAGIVNHLSQSDINTTESVTQITEPGTSYEIETHKEI